jgi:hypothetical protein
LAFPDLNGWIIIRDYEDTTMSSNRKSAETKFTIVSQQAANQDPYLYVFVQDDGTVRELRPDERAYLETPFLPSDGARPAIKDSYTSKNGWGSQQGFCQRAKIPAGIEVLKPEPPASPLQEDPADPQGQSDDGQGKV